MKPSVATAVYIFNDKGEVLLTKMPKWKNKYGIPGGRVEFGESTKNCAIREVKEETNLEIKDVELIDIFEAIFPEEFNGKLHSIFFTYKAKAVTNKIILNEEHTDYIWVLPENCPEDANIYTKRQLKKF